MRKALSVAVFACALSVAGTAGAGITIDVFWADAAGSGIGTALTVDAGDPGAFTSGQCGGGNGINSVGAAGRCMKVQWTTDEPVYAGGNSVVWDGGADLNASFASFFPAFQAIPVGKSATFAPFPNSSVNINNGTNQASTFGGSSPIPATGTDAVPAGTYVVGTIVFDTAGAAPGSYNILAAIIGGAGDAFLALDGSTAITNITLNGAVLNVVPEPGTASLLGLGLLGLVAASRRRKN